MPAVLSVPVHPDEWTSSKKRKSLGSLPDLAVWSLSDEEIIDPSKETWRSPAYAHYSIELHRVFDWSSDPPTPIELVFRFVCRYHDAAHIPLQRGRMKTGHGTTPLLDKAKECDRRRGIQMSLVGKPHIGDDRALYSEAWHRAILALWGAHCHRSFESLTDKFHRMEVDYLRPGTTLPDPTTLSRDIKAIHARYSPKIKEYFQTIPGAIHLAIDGWTSPTSDSYLGVIIIWYENTQIHRCILEFIRLTASHTGAYLADNVASCLERYGLEKKILAACLDNAANNSTLVQELQQRIPHFQGTRSYVRCLAHIINLMAKAFMSPFSRPNSRTKKLLERAVTTSASRRAARDFLQSQQASSADPDELEEPETNDMDEAKLEHDTLVVQDVVLQAIEQISTAHGIKPTMQELMDAQAIMTSVAGLARRVDESPVARTKFLECISMCPELKNSDRRALSRRVPTRWNSDRKALDDHLHLWRPVQLLTSDEDLKLDRFALGSKQRLLAEELNEALEVFDIPTRHFSSNSIPLVHQVLPALVEMKESLVHMQNSTDISPVTRIGAQAALNVFNKYMENMSICEVYFISIVMCPDVKLTWFRKHYDSTSVEKIRDMVSARFKILYPPSVDSESQFNPQATKPKNRWICTQVASPAPALALETDSVDIYMNSETEAVTGYGGVIPYWSAMLETSPRVARMALNYLTAPATSVDAERAFSAGRLTINHLQHNMAPKTFEAKMAVGSWYGTPLLPGVAEIASVLQETM